MPEFPRTGVLDSGAGSDADPIGGNWTTLSGTFVTSALKRLSNTIRPSAADAGAEWSAETYAQDQEVFVTIANASVTQSTGEPTVGLVLRGTNLTGGSGTAYVAYLMNDTEPVYEIEIWRIVLSGGGVIVPATGQFTFDTGDTFGFRAVGAANTALTCYKNGSEILSFSDSTTPITGGGRIGVTANDTDWQLINFGGGSYVAPAPEKNWSAHPKYKLRRAI
jgi:hypothetical protein